MCKKYPSTITLLMAILLMAAMCQMASAYPGRGGSCTDCTCINTCDTTCVLSDIPNEIMRNAGTYVVRLYTPDPVSGGVGTSLDTAFLNIIAFDSICLSV